MRFFLNNSFILISILILFAFWVVGFYIGILLYLIFIGIVAFFTRRISPHHQEDATLKDGVFYAPVNGRVTSINLNVNHPQFGESLTEVVFTLSWVRESGLYFPAKSEVIELFFEKGKSFFRYFQKINPELIDKYSSLLLKFQTLDDQHSDYGVQLIKCPLGMWPQVRVIPGDLGRAQVNFGFFGLGGTVVFYLPPQYEILVKEGLKATAGQTIVAALNEESDRILIEK